MFIRLAVLVATILVAVVVGLVLAAILFPPPTAGVRLAGVTVAIGGYTLDQPAAPASDRHRIDVTLVIDSPRAIDACLAFAIDAPFAGRRLVPATEGCLRPRAGRQTVSVSSTALTDDDLAFPSHTLVWGVRGGRCGLVFEALGVCVVEQAGTATLELPATNPLGSFPPLGSFIPIPIFSFEPIPQLGSPGAR